MLLHQYQHPKMDFDSILVTLNFKELSKKELLEKIPFLVKKYKEIRTSRDETAGVRWVMGNLSRMAMGNISLRELRERAVNGSTQEATRTRVTRPLRPYLEGRFRV